MKRLFVFIFCTLFATSLYAAPIPFSEYKFISRGMSQAEVYLRAGQPDYIVETNANEVVTKRPNGRIVKHYNTEQEAVWYGDGGSTPATIITFENGKVKAINRTSFGVGGRSNNVEIFNGS